MINELNITLEERNSELKQLSEAGGIFREKESELVATIEELNHKLDEKNNEIVKVNETNADANKRESELLATIEELKESVGVDRVEISRLTETNVKFASEESEKVQSIKAELSELQTQQEKTVDIEAIHLEEVSTLKTEIESLATIALLADSRQNELEAEKSAAVAQSATISEKLQTQEDEYTSLKVELSSLKLKASEVTELERLHNEQVEEIDLLHDELEQVTTAAAERETEHKQQVARLEDELQTLADSYVQVEMTTARLNEKLEERMAAYDDIECHAAELRHEKAAVVVELGNADKELEQSRQRERELSEEVQRAESTVPEKARDELRQMRDRVVGLENEKSSLLKRVRNGSAGDSGLVHRCEELRVEAEQYSAEYRRAQNEIVVLCERVSKLESENEVTRGKLLRAERENEEFASHQYELPDAYREELQQAEDEVERLRAENIVMLQNQNDIGQMYHFENRIAELEEENDQLRQHGVPGTGNDEELQQLREQVWIIFRE